MKGVEVKPYAQTHSKATSVRKAHPADILTFNGFTGSLEAKTYILPEPSSGLPRCLSPGGRLGAEEHLVLLQKRLLGLHPYTKPQTPPTSTKTPSPNPRNQNP
jgi:hypothetical protein